ncbi:MAG: hypothetical protein Q3979_04845 [Actinomycetaceae bacterium]|nr:hypothetical protein [Actinomycetaceae bacterium]
MKAEREVILDTGPLSALAEAGWLGVLRSLARRNSWRLIAECAVLARTLARGGKAIIDDAQARRLAQRERADFTGTLGLLVEAVRAHYLTVDMVGDLADDLIAVHYRLPFPPGGFARWARQEAGLS